MPDSFTLSRRRLRGKPLPPTLTVYDDQANTELYIDTRRIRSAYLLDIAPDRTILNT